MEKSSKSGDSGELVGVLRGLRASWRLVEVESMLEPREDR